jgi:hypothetical protein
MKPLNFWTTDGFDITSYKWKLEHRINQTQFTSGGNGIGYCKYTYNELGFRGDSIHKNGFKVMSIGCSLTEGSGVNDSETWPHQFCKHIPNSVDNNFGVCIMSNDYISRCLLTYYDLIKPDLVLIMYTFPHRREVFTEDGGIEPFMATSALDYFVETEDGKTIQKLLTELQNDNEDLINWYKNHQLIKYFLESKKCNWLWNGSFLNTDYTDKLRFDGEYKNYLDLGVDKRHPGPRHNYEYSIRLFKYIRNNFKNYLPEECEDKLRYSII